MMGFLFTCLLMIPLIESSFSLSSEECIPPGLSYGGKMSLITSGEDIHGNPQAWTNENVFIIRMPWSYFKKRRSYPMFGRTGIGRIWMAENAPCGRVHTELPCPNIAETENRLCADTTVPCYMSPPTYSPNSTILSFHDVTPTSINVTWRAWDEELDDGHGPIVGYRIKIREAGEGTFVAVPKGMQLSHRFENLTENTEYEFQITVIRDHPFGEGRPSYIQRCNTSQFDATAPDVTCPRDIVVNIIDESSRSTTADFLVSCSDHIDGRIQPNCNATTNITPFLIGVTNVSCSCEDNSGNSGECSFKVTVKDVTPPALTCPRDIVVNIIDESSRGTTADFLVSCSDHIDGRIQPNCNATTNTTQFLIGETNVSCSCEDNSGNSGECSFKVTVKDVTAPTVTCPRDIVLNITDESSRSITADFLVSCSDHIDGRLQPHCNATTNITPFLIGETNVSCLCDDHSGNTGECSFKVTVRDETEPAVTCPRDIVVNITDESSRSITADFLVSCSDHIDGRIQPNCNATTNTTPFLIGETSVSCSCDDHSGNTGECSFKVTVKDVIAPNATCPSQILVNITEESIGNATTNFLVQCWDAVDGHIQPICNATENVTHFAVGETLVSCTCEDYSGNTNDCSFTVAVEDVTAFEDTEPLNLNVTSSGVFISSHTKLNSFTNSVIGYKVMYRVKGTTTWADKEIKDFPAALGDLQELATYEIAIALKYGEGIYSQISRLQTFNTPCQDINVTLALSSGSLRNGYASIRADWSIPSLLPGCAVVNQTVSIQQIDLDNCEFTSGLTNKSETVASDRRHYRTWKMQPHSEYNVTLTITTRSNVYNVWKTLRTLETAPTGSPNLSFVRSNIGNKRLILRWHKVPCGQRNGVVTSYEVKMERAGVTMVHNTKSRMFAYSNFEKGQQFSVQVRAVTSRGVGPYSKLHKGSFGEE